jgi:hypothetical protein
VSRGLPRGSASHSGRAARTTWLRQRLAAVERTSATAQGGERGCMRLRAARSGQMTHQNLSTAAVQSRTCPLLWTTHCCRQRLAACFRTGDGSALAQRRKGAALDASVRASGWKRARQGAGGAWRRFSPGPSAGRLGKRCAPRIELVTPHARPGVINGLNSAEGVKSRQANMCDQEPFATTRARACL